MGGDRTPIIHVGQFERGAEPWVVAYEHKVVVEDQTPLTQLRSPADLRRITVEEAAAIQALPQDLDSQGRLSAEFRPKRYTSPREVFAHDGRPPIADVATTSTESRTAGWREGRVVTESACLPDGSGACFPCDQPPPASWSGTVTVVSPRFVEILRSQSASRATKQVGKGKVASVGIERESRSFLRGDSALSDHRMKQLGGGSRAAQ
jgi:hypothetical protein